MRDICCHIYSFTQTYATNSAHFVLLYYFHTSFLFKCLYASLFGDRAPLYASLFGDCAPLYASLFGDCAPLYASLFGDCAPLYASLYGDCAPTCSAFLLCLSLLEKVLHMPTTSNQFPLTRDSCLAVLTCPDVRFTYLTDTRYCVCPYRCSRFRSYRTLLQPRKFGGGSVLFIHTLDTTSQAKEANRQKTTMCRR